jgi:hypothetical protein
MSADNVTLQVNVAPSDLPYAKATLSHQLRRLEQQVAEVIYTLDLRKSAGPRGRDFERHTPGMLDLIHQLTAPTGRHLIEVDYADAALQAVGDRFFGGRRPPTKDAFGAPFYAYFFGLANVDTRYVLHLDSDILLGGGSLAWVSEAVELIRSRREVLFACPLAGPPTGDGRIPRDVRRAHRRTQARGSAPVLESESIRAYRLRHVSSRVFLTDLERLAAAGPLPILDAERWTFGSDLAVTPYLPAETTLSHAMQQHGLLRIDYLGTSPGMWFVHPLQRGPAFNANLPGLIAELEDGAYPGAQAGRFELLDSWLDAAGPAPFARPLPPVRQRAGRLVGTVTGLRAARIAYWKTAARVRRSQHPRRHVPG